MHHHRLLSTTLLILLLSCTLVSGQSRKEEKASRPYLGVLVGPAGGGERGLLVREVTPSSPAAKAGLKNGDRVVKIDDQDVTDVETFLKAIAARKPGEQLNLQAVRDGREQNLVAVLGARPATSDFPPGGFPELPSIRRPAYLGVQTQVLTPELRKQRKAEADAGVVVTEVRPNSPAAKAGLKQDDVITAVNDRPVKSPAELREAVQEAGPGKEVALQVVRGEEKLALKATLGEGTFSFYLTPGQDRFPALDVESMSDQARRLRELERRVEELEKRLRELEKKPK
jgi:serine protease Do